MKKITDKIIKKFKEYLIDEEKSKATIEKYIRDLTVFLGSAVRSSAKQRFWDIKSILFQSMLRQVLIPYFHHSTAFLISLRNMA